uniref:Uncharacterized protein n=1 Tax=Meloidogyne enterolobii TaxID=390850 RepID=A0A6V7TLT9_MELEN|nr:unnamed protein product [Meloidogyne enterolobii]
MPSTKVGGKTNNRNNQNCGSSSSDEAEHIGGTCSGGWPSAVSVLETPDRRRVRSSLRSNNKNSSRTHSIPEVSFPSSISTHLSFASTSSVIANDNSPPTCRLSTNSFCSPPLRTPRQSLTASIHLSGSPLRSFFIKEKRQQSPSCSSSISSTTSCSNSRDQVLRPLNLQNYIGVRFSGDRPAEQTQNQQKSSNLHQEKDIKNVDKNKTTKDDKQQSRRVSKDSGFSDTQLSDDQNSRLSLLSKSSLIETPSKGLASVQPLYHSTPILNERSSSSLLLFDTENSNYNPSTSSGFHSPLQEQNYGPLETSIVDDILNDLDKMQPEKLQTPEKNRNPTRSLKFERKLLSLKWRRESPRKKTNNSLLEWQKIERINISSLFIEGINNELNVGNLKKEISALFSQTDCQLMFGKSTDQLEITEKAKNLLNINPPTKKLRKKLTTKSAGLIPQLKEEKRIKL